MSAYFVTYRALSRTQQEIPPESQNSGCSHNYSHLTVNGIFCVYSNPLRRLLTTIFAVIIFVALPIYDSRAEFPLPGMQMPAASFDRKESVLDRFRTFSGKKTRSALEGLFKRFDPVFSQNPPIVLSDGIAVARITLQLQGHAGGPPIFSISGGHCVSAKMSDTGNWILEIRPNRGSFSTSLTVAFPGQMTEYPLTVAPPTDLFERRNADTAVVNYVKTANHLAAAGMNPERK